jgi:hypothetical protein
MIRALGARVLRAKWIIANPKSPITMDGVPDKKSTINPRNACWRREAYSARYIPLAIPTGMAMMDDRITSKDVPRRAGQIPSKTGD